MRNNCLLKVSGLKEGQTQQRFQLTPAEIPIEPAHGCRVTLTRDVVADLELLRRNERVYVSGKVDFEAELDCSVCAETFRKSFQERLYVEFEPGQGAPAKRMHELGEDELIRTFYTADEIDLLPVIRDTILLAIPIAPTCVPDCKGICPECGANLNKEECSCCHAAVSK